MRVALFLCCSSLKVERQAGFEISKCLCGCGGHLVMQVETFEVTLGESPHVVIDLLVMTKGGNCVCLCEFMCTCWCVIVFSSHCNSDSKTVGLIVPWSFHLLGGRSRRQENWVREMAALCSGPPG